MWCFATSTMSQERSLRQVQIRYASDALDWTGPSATLLNEATPHPLEAIARPPVTPAVSGILKRSFSARSPLAGRFPFFSKIRYGAGQSAKMAARMARQDDPTSVHFE